MNTLKVLLVSVLLTVSSVVAAQSEEALASMQQQLNAKVIEKPFSVADERRIMAYVKYAMEKDLKPATEKAPSYWQPGYSCADIYDYGWETYRDCRYYRHYYGYYWY